ncbi:porin family protein [Flavobacterium sp.]|uniref:porin family protein n=1 Tax=Flavobacterium sp. TaxID=239 RepID=UPI0037503F19
MKKLLFAAVAVIAFGSANAQETKFGAKAGLNMSNLTGDVEDNSMKVGFHIGGFVNIGISEKFSVQPELLYNTGGAKFTGGSTNLSYLSIPVMAQYNITEEFSLEAGPQIGFLMSANDKADGGGSVDIKDSLNSTDFGLNLGLGYDVAENINIGLRYTIGMSNILKDSGDIKIGTSNLGLSLAYTF